MEEKAREQRRTDKSESGTLFKKSSFSRPSIHFFLKKRIEVSVGSVLLYSVLRLRLRTGSVLQPSCSCLCREQQRDQIRGEQIYCIYICSNQRDTDQIYWAPIFTCLNWIIKGLHHTSCRAGSDQSLQIKEGCFHPNRATILIDLLVFAHIRHEYR